MFRTLIFSDVACHIQYNIKRFSLVFAYYQIRARASWCTYELIIMKPGI